ncbi:hypothetical protein ABC766_26550 [Methylobacterium fujisawaense]|uniref:hypothetical protein n=1 Tax=Methylobacterium fujisawaense TaxID=107400 RepID=UPI0031F52726
MIGCVTPITAMSFGIANAPVQRPAIAFFAAIWPCAAMGLHWIGRRVLRRIRP